MKNATKQQHSLVQVKLCDFQKRLYMDRLQYLRQLLGDEQESEKNSVVKKDGSLSEICVIRQEIADIMTLLS